MELTSSQVDVLLIIGAILLGNYVSVRIMKVELQGIKDKLKDHETRIQELYDRTRYVLTGHQVRESIKEEVHVTHDDIKELKHLCSSIQTEVTNIKLRCKGCNSRGSDNVG